MVRVGVELHEAIAGIVVISVHGGSGQVGCGSRQGAGRRRAQSVGEGRSVGSECVGQMRQWRLALFPSTEKQVSLDKMSLRERSRRKRTLWKKRIALLNYQQEYA